MNDLGLVRDPELRELSLEILDMFGISEKVFDRAHPECSQNRRIHDPSKMKKLLKTHTN
jgi:hypothetical protein